MMKPKVKNELVWLMKILNSTKGTPLGFTLIESLVAVVVVGILLSAIAPMVALSAAARVNARRVDLATQAARSYVEGVRGGVIDVVNFPSTLLAPVAATAPYFNSIPAPNASGGISFALPADCSNANYPGVCVDTNNNGFSTSDPQDLVIQPMRTGDNNATTLVNNGYLLGVRVYRADSFASGSGVTFYRGDESQCAQSKQIFGASSAGRQCPLGAMSSEIVGTKKF